MVLFKSPDLNPRHFCDKLVTDKVQPVDQVPRFFYPNDHVVACCNKLEPQVELHNIIVIPTYILQMALIFLIQKMGFL